MRVQDYDSVPSSIREFSVAAPEFFNWGFDVVDVWGKEKGDHQAIVYTDDDGNAIRNSFSEVVRKTGQLAYYFVNQGLKKGDSVLSMFPSAPALWLAVVALIKVGVVIVPSAPTQTPKDLEYGISRAGVKGVVTDANDVKKVPEVFDRDRGRLWFLARTGTNDHAPTPSGWADLTSIQGESSS
jgi:acetyl-CoA synthetase